MNENIDQASSSNSSAPLAFPDSESESDEQHVKNTDINCKNDFNCAENYLDENENNITIIYNPLYSKKKDDASIYLNNDLLTPNFYKTNEKCSTIDNNKKCLIVNNETDYQLSNNSIVKQNLQLQHSIVLPTKLDDFLDSAISIVLVCVFLFLI